MNREFLDLGDRVGKATTSNTDESLLGLFTPASLHHEHMEEPVGMLPCPEWAAKLAATHPDDLSSTERAELDEHLRLCPACRAMQDHDRSIDDFICNSFFGASPHFGLSSELPQFLERMWEFQGFQESLASQKAKGIYTQYMPNEQIRREARLVPLSAPLEQLEERVGKPALAASRAYWWRGFAVAAIMMIAALSILSTSTYQPIHAWSAAPTVGPAVVSTLLPATVTPALTLPNQEGNAASRPTPTLSPPRSNALSDLEQRGALALNDPLRDNSVGNQWSEYDTGPACMFDGGAYHSRVQQEGFLTECHAQSSQFGNFAFQVQMTITQGDGGGLIFRSEGTGLKMYRFRVSQDGTYDLYVSYGSNDGRVVSLGFDSAINEGLHQTNFLAVVAIGSNIDLYVNQQRIAHVSDDSAISPGEIGLFAYDFMHPTDAAFSNARVWRL